MDWEPRDYKMETTTLWSFPGRGKWATHNGQYRGNWSPYIPRNIIERYSLKMICTHPPYSNIIRYSKGIEGELSNYDIDKFVEEISIVQY